VVRFPVILAQFNFWKCGAHGLMILTASMWSGQCPLRWCNTLDQEYFPENACIFANVIELACTHVIAIFRLNEISLPEWPLASIPIFYERKVLPFKFGLRRCHQVHCHAVRVIVQFSGRCDSSNTMIIEEPDHVAEKFVRYKLIGMHAACGYLPESLALCL